MRGRSYLHGLALGQPDSDLSAGLELYVRRASQRTGARQALEWMDVGTIQACVRQSLVHSARLINEVSTGLRMLTETSPLCSNIEDNSTHITTFNASNNSGHCHPQGLPRHSDQSFCSRRALRQVLGLMKQSASEDIFTEVCVLSVSSLDRLSVAPRIQSLAHYASTLVLPCT